MTGSDAAGERRAAVLAALKSASGGVSGEALAAELGISRVAVRKHVQALAASGYAIDATPGSGYVLVAAPDAPLPAEVAPLLRSAVWNRLEGGGVTGSTNDDARALALAGAREGAAVLASRQTAGRGRFGREWVSPEGGVYVSVVLRPACVPSELASLPLAVGLGVARGLETLGATPALKWPNDLVVLDRRAPKSGAARHWRKLAGILLESSIEGERVSWVVAGIGVNVRRATADRDTACLEEQTGPVGLATVAAAILDGVAGAYLGFAEGGFATLATDYRRRDALAGSEVTVSGPAGALVAAGTAAAVDADGRLVVRTPGGEVRVSAGEVTLARV